ncbi:MAG: helix-turn-helix transcriptional regulator [Ardenticatenaceae bacterium]|nr:helix-turn-helix transcriptional regulator [Ardenticatenaceae bacterium]
MPTSLLQTKLYAPRKRPLLVPRPHLIEKLNQGIHHKLTLISAPAGFGKTTLISEWIAAEEWPTAWLSLDEGDADPIRFLTYFVAALQRVAPEIGHTILAGLQSPQPPPVASILTNLLNEIAAMPQDVLFVLDDYHRVEAKAVDEALAFLLEHLPPTLHLVITTREDPQLQLPRLRARGLLTELRAADLRFTEVEAAVFLNEAMNLDLSPADVASLEARTEGWIAGLQLAALALQGHAAQSGPGERSQFIQAVAGDNRYIVDYLVAEVLEHQPEPLRRFLLQTSILNRLSGPLCAAVTGLANGSSLLETLERTNLFVISLDDKRHWYRYHHLFADVLKAHLKREQAEALPELHRRASLWYEQNNALSDAIRHALLAQDFARAADLIELAWPPIFNGIQPARWLHWINTLPDEMIRTRPVLSAGFAWTLLDIGEPEAAEARLRDVEQWLSQAPTETTSASCPKSFAADSRQMVVANQKAFQSLPASTASARAYWALSLGDMPAAIQHARRALDLFAEEEHYQRGIAAQFLGLAYWTGGELAQAYEAMADSVASVRLAGNTYFQIVGMVFQAYIRMAQGRLQAAAALYEQLLQLVTEQEALALRGATDLYIGLGELHNEWGDLETAVNYLLLGQKLNEQAVLPGSMSRWHVAMARIKMTEGDLVAAQNLLRQVDQLYKRDPFPTVHLAAALQAQIWAAQGQLTPALDWVKAQALTVNSELSYLREFEHLTLARILLAQYRLEQQDDVIAEAIHLLDRLWQAAEAGGWGQSQIEILILQALAYQASGEMAKALTFLQRALSLAEPEGYVRVFMAEGQPMRELLAICLTQGAAPAYVTHLMQAIEPVPDEAAAPPDPNQLLIEPLSERELEVLALIANGLTNQAIAEELVIALSTVKKHVNNILGKLNVGNRTEATSRARELNIL